MFYARVMPPLGCCVGFYDKKLRGDWVEYQNKKDRERHDKLLAQCGLKENALPYDEPFRVISAKEAMKRFGEKDPWGERKVRVHRVLTSLSDRW